MNQLREFAKLVARGAATLLVLPSLLSYAVRASVLGRDRALQGSSQALALVPGLLGQYLRRAFLARVLAGCHATATIEFGVVFSHAGARIGSRSYVGPYSTVGFADIGDHALIGPGVHVLSGAHTHNAGGAGVPMREQPVHRTQVRIGRGAWVGAGAIVMADVGEHCVVGAGAVVTKPVPGHQVAVGVPARFRDG